MTRGWHSTKLSLSSALLSFSGRCILLLLLSFCRICFVSLCFFGGKRHNRVHPGHFATQQGTPFYPAGMSAADWSTIVFTLPRRKMAWVHPTMATFFQNCTLILDKYPVVSENETLPPAISPAEITLRSRQRAPKYTSSRAKHTVRNRHQGPASSSA